MSAHRICLILKRAWSVRLARDSGVFRGMCAVRELEKENSAVQDKDSSSFRTAGLAVYMVDVTY
jgi:hypothetical protein